MGTYTEFVDEVREVLASYVHREYVTDDFVTAMAEIARENMPFDVFHAALLSYVSYKGSIVPEILYGELRALRRAYQNDFPATNTGTSAPENKIVGEEHWKVNRGELCCCCVFVAAIIVSVYISCGVPE